MPLVKRGVMEKRAYQEAIFLSARSKNTLCVLPTGLGKTPISVMLAADRLSIYPGSKVMVMAPTKPLVNQHYKTFVEFMDIPKDEMAVVTGTVPPGTRETEYDCKRIVFATPQTIQNDLKKGRIDFKKFSLLVVDEMHHAIGRYAYPFVSQKYLKESEHPRILGLTASPGSSRSKIEEICRNCGIDNIEIRGETDRDVSPYVKEKKIEWRTVELPESFLDITVQLKRAYEKRIGTLKRMGFLRGRSGKKQLLMLQTSLIRSINEGYRKAFLGIRACTQAIKIEHALGLIETQSVQALENYFRKLRSEPKSKRLLSDPNVSQAESLCHRLAESGASHPKISAICSIVDSQLRKKPDSRIIIFANFRDTVREIYRVLEKIEGIEPVILIGQKEGLTQKQQIEVMKTFGEGDRNVLVCTSIGEEGLDIAEASMAIFYEAVASEIRQIQRRGRVGRTKIGKIVVLITRNTRDEAYRWAAYHKERRMKGVLRKMQDETSGPETSQARLDSGKF